MSDETVAGSKKPIPVEEKIKMYGNRAKMEAVRIEDSDNIRKFDEAMHDTKEYKRYARAKKLADLKYDRKIEELRQRAGSMIDATEGYEKAESFMKMSHSAGFKNLDSCMDTFKRDSQRYKQQLDEAESSNSDEYRAFREYNDLVTKKNAEIADKEGDYQELYKRNVPPSVSIHADWHQKIDQWFDEIDESERRLAENPDKDRKSVV